MPNQNTAGKEPAGRTAERRSTGMQICRPTTVKIRRKGASINLPRTCRDMQYRRYTAITGIITFIPEGTHLTGGKKVTPRKDGYRTYAPMPAGTVGIRYRRVINRTTGVVTLTPISWPQIRRVTRRKEEEQ